MGSMAIAADTSSMGGGGNQSPVLRVIVENLFYPVTLDVLHQVKAVSVALLSSRTVIMKRLFPSLSHHDD